MERIEVTSDEPLKAGDIIELTYRISGLVPIAAAQVAILEKRINKQPEYQVIRSDTATAKRWSVQIKIIDPAPIVKIQQAGLHLTVGAAVAAITILGGGLFAWLSLESVHKIIAPAGKIGAAITVTTVAVVVAYLIWKK